MKSSVLSWSLIPAFLLLFSIHSNAQWNWQNPRVTGNDLNAVDFGSASNGWIAGNGGTILNTIDSGNTWTIQNSNSCSNFADIQFADSQEGWIAGDSGTILHTVNGGALWSVQNSGTTESLHSMSFINNSEGWIISESHLLHTTNGGENWDITDAAVTGFDIHFSSHLNGWISSYFGNLYHTSDGGLNWLPQESSVSENLLSISSVSDNEAWIAGVPGIIHTSNGGLTWSSQTGSCCKFYKSVSFIDSLTGWAVGETEFLHTTDGGINWISEDLPYPVNAVQLISPQKGVIIGTGVIQISEDSGDSFQNKIGSVSNADLRCVNFSSNTSGWSVGTSGTIIHTTNGGTDWAIQNSGTTSDLFAVSPATDSEAWICGNMQDSLLHTTDGGASWSVQNSGTPEFLNSIFFTTNLNGWAVGNNGVIVHTSNGGLNWENQISGILISLHSVFFTDQQNGWTAGEGGIVLHTVDGGQSWVNQLSGTLNDLNGVHFISTTEGWAAGATETIIHTTNAGAAWTILPTTGGDFLPISSIFFINADSGWVTSFFPSVSFTSDGGQTWTPQNCSQIMQLNSIYFKDNRGWIVGDHGRILSISTAESSSSVNELTAATENAFVYPNPVVNEASLIYHSRKKQVIKIGLYDITGKQLRTVVNEEQAQGKHTVFIRKENLSPGLYFIKIEAGSEIEIKRIILE